MEEIALNKLCLGFC